MASGKSNFKAGAIKLGQSILHGLKWVFDLFLYVREIFLEYFNRTPVTKVWKWFILTVGGLILFIAAIDTNFLWLFGKSPSVSKLENPKVEQASELYSADGVLMGKYYKENRVPVEFKEINPIVFKALIATEDVRFYEHSGVDPRALGSAVMSVFLGDARGASTITQQLAKNLYKIRGEGSQGLLGYIPLIKTIIYKTKEWLTAIKLENAYTKDEIITMYLNTVDFGSNSFGIKTASQTYFSKLPKNLSIQEAATLVGLLKATTSYSPIQHPDRSFKRRNTVLAQMAKYNVITAHEADSISRLKIVLTFSLEKHYDGAGTYFRGIMNSYLKTWCEEKGYDLYTDGLKIYTTIDSRLQQHAENAVSEHLHSLQKKFYQHWKNKGNPWVGEDHKELPLFIETVAKRTERYKSLVLKYGAGHDSILIVMNTPRAMKVFTWENTMTERDTVLSPMDSIRYYKWFLHAGFMSMDPYSGQIKAWVGGINYKYFKYDHVRQAQRQPGSTFKPFVYLAAIDRAGLSPCHRVKDQPVSISYVEDGKPKVWAPKNSDSKFSGDSMTLRRAMAKSVNSITAQLTQIVGWETVIEYAKKLGIQSPLKPVPSIGLGSSDVNLYEMVGAYATFLNHGVHTTPMFITRIEDRNGNTLHEFVPERKQVISEETAWLMIHMLKGGLEEPGGTSQALFQYDLFRGNEFGGKTGTSQNHSDGWFMGLTKDLVSGMWVGADDRSIHFRTSSMGEGARTALPIYGHFMEKVYADTSLHIKMGYFPKARIKITKKYNCPTRLRAKVDTTIVIIDSTSVMPNVE